MKFWKRLCGVFVLASIGLSCPVLGQPYTEIIAFGDEATDMGNYSTAPLTNNSLAYGRKIWVKHLANLVGIRNFLPSNRGGTNYAERTGELDDQVSEYLNRGVETGNDVLHVIWSGSFDVFDDLLGYILNYYSRKTTVQDLGRRIAERHGIEIRRLASAGAKNILWVNLPDYTSSPLGQSLIGSRGHSEYKRGWLREMCAAYNRQLNREIDDLRNSYPRLNIIKLDVATYIEELLADSTLALDPKNSDGHLYNYLNQYWSTGFTSHAHYLIALHALSAISGQPPIAAVVSVEAADPRGNESGGNAAILFRRMGSTKEPLFVRYGLFGTARNGKDYKELPGWVVIPKGRSQVRLVVKPISDKLHEGQETLTLRLRKSSRIHVGDSRSATVRISD